MTSPLGSVDKALLTLEALAPAGPAGIGLAELAQQLGLAKPTLHRTLSALVHRGYARSDGGRYSLGPASITLATTYLAEENLPALVRPALEAACAELHELVHLGALAGPDEVIYLDKVEPERPLRVWSAVGRRVPAKTSALGRALNTSVNAEEVEENEPGIACVAVPILRDGQAIAAVSVTAPAERLTTESRTAVVVQLAGILRRELPSPLTVPTPRAPAARAEAL